MVGEPEEEEGDQEVKLRKSMILAASAAAAVAAATAWAMIYGSKRSKILGPSLRPYPIPSLDDPGMLDYDSEETDEPEPPGIIYADDKPCDVPPQPWDVVSSSGAVAFELEGDDTGCVPPSDLEPVAKTEVVFAAGGSRPAWPLSTDDEDKLRVSYKDVRGLFHGKWGREFGATRKSRDKETGAVYRRVHVGVDLFADDGDVVVAMEPGTVLAALPYYKGLGALYVLNDSGIIVNYGELKMNSWIPFGIKSGIGSGQRVEAGQALARVGTATDGSHMLHIETFTPDTTTDEIRRGELRWISGDPAPSNVLDPTRYLVRARQVALEAKEA